MKKETSLNILEVKIKGKKFNIDLTTELSISETRLNQAIVENPSVFVFLSQLKNEAIAKRDELERQKDIIFSKVYIATIESNPRATKELANHKANVSTKYQVANKEFLAEKERADKLISICRAFEMKAQLLQTLSSNLRKE